MIRTLRIVLLAIFAAGLALSGGAARAADLLLPIVFVHGNGDTAALWLTTIWRFESNGYPGDRLVAVDLRHPTARTVDDQPEAGRSSTADVMMQLAQEVDRVRERTGAEKVILVAQSRGGNTVRNYLKNGGGAAHVAMTVLCGAVNHGVIVSDKYLVGSEFNGTSAFMRDLNSTPGEIVAGVRFMTIRSDSNDKYAQADGRFIGLPNVATGLGFDAPELKGATNFILPGIDHRETGYGPAAFAAMYRFILDREPATSNIVPERSVVLDGKASGFEAGTPTNIGVADATVTIYPVDPRTGERLAGAAHRQATGGDGRWGPFRGEPDAFYEFVVEMQGYPATHIFRSPFPRSSAFVHLRPQVIGKDEAAAGSVVYLTRPRGYFGLGRDNILLDGAQPPGLAPGVPSVSSATLALPAEAQRSVTGRFNDEQITARTWPLKDNQASVIELTY